MLELRPSNSGGYRAYWDNGALVGEIYREVDGYYVWWPQERAGCWAAYYLRAIADKLDELNKEFDAQVRRECCGPSTEPIAGRSYVQSPDSGVPWDE